MKEKHSIYKTISVIALTALFSVLVPICIFGSKYLPRKEFEDYKRYSEAILKEKLLRIETVVDEINKKLDRNIKAGVLVIDDTKLAEGAAEYGYMLEMQHKRRND